MTAKAAFAAASSTNIKSPDYNFGAVDNKPNKKGRSDKANGPIFHFMIQIAEKIVPAIARIITPAVLSMMVSMRFSRALICS
jgi:hypothetical protein